MNDQEHQIHLAAVSWFFQSACQGSIAIALALLARRDVEEEEIKWAWRPPRRFGGVRRTIDVWKSERRGGLNNKYFEFFCRFKKKEVKELAYLLDIPTEFDIDARVGWPNASTDSPEDSFLVFLWRNAHPVALGYLMLFFGRSRPWLSRVWNGVLHHIWNTWGERIELDRQLLTPRRIDLYAAAIGNSLGTDEDSIFGFIDGTEVAICRPNDELQGQFYSGHKKQHSIGHLAIVLPDGLFGSIFTGLPAAGGDATLCIQIGLGDKLRGLLSHLPDGQIRYIYGDAAFGSQEFVLGPYKKSRGRALTPTQKKINQWLSTKRIVVEHGFGGVKTNFKLITYRRVLQQGLSPVGIYMPVFAFLWNCRTCIRRGNEISIQFDVAPPTVEEYVKGTMREELEGVREEDFDGLMQ